MSFKGVIYNSYRALEDRRALLIAGTVVLAALCLLALSRATMTADIKTMLPGGQAGSMAEDFDLLNRSTLSNRIMITVRGTEGVSRDELSASAETLAKALPPKLFTVQSASAINPQQVLAFLATNAPNLMGEKELQAVKNKLSPAQVRRQLGEDYSLLTSPQGLAAKQMVRLDPLGLHSLLTPRLARYRAFSNVTLHQGRVFSKDGDALLLTATTPVAMTDADGAQRLVDAFATACTALPAGVTADMLSGHAHTLANASVIKRDLAVISAVSLAALGLLFFFCFRSVRALGVLAAPLLSLCAALGMTALCFEPVSAIVIGFGAVLLGISIDFSMHAYYAVSSRPDNPGEALASLSTPLLFGLVTSCAAFGALFLSGIPGIQQLAFFSIAGLVTAALYALFVLPHIGGAAPTKAAHAPCGGPKRHPRGALFTAIGLLLTGAILSWNASLDTDLRSMGYMSKDIRRAEQAFNKSWGDARSKAVVFTNAPDMGSAMARNEQVWNMVRAQLPQVQGASLAPLLPGLESQADNRARWTGFWTRDKRRDVQDLLTTEGRQFRFSPRAFQPFLDGLKTTPQPVTPATLKQGGLGMLLEIMAPSRQKGDTQLLTFLPDTAEVRALFTPERERKLGARLVSRIRFKENLESTMERDIVRFITASGLSVLLLAFLLFRNVRRSLLSLLPPGFGVVTVFATLTATHTPMNLFHIVALPLVIGLGADYGIFMVCRERDRLPLSTVPAIRLSGLTTLAAFGVLALARHPSLHSLGMTVLLGVGAALLAALYLLPHLLEQPSGRAECV